MNDLPNPLEQEMQRFICRGEDLLARTHEVAQNIVNRVSRAIDSLPTRDQDSFHDEAAFRR